MAKYKNKFFDKIKYKSSASENVVFGMNNDRRMKAWKEEQKQWGGWDERVGWCLDNFMVEQIYTWLCIYYKNASKWIDLTFYKFDINGEELTQGECIQRAINDMKYYLLNPDSFDNEVNKKTSERIQEAFQILGIILPALWW